MTHYIDVDVRPVLRSGGEPFSVIMAALQGLEPGQGMRLYATFKPLPLFAVMAEKGFAHSEREIDGGQWEVLFTPADVKPDRAVANLSAFEEWPEPAVKVDNRDLDPPEPMIRILAAADQLAPGETLSALLRRIVFSAAEDLKQDAQGRILLSQRLREFAGIQEDVLIAGVNSHLELWNPQQWEEKVMSKVAHPEVNGEVFRALGI